MTKLDFSLSKKPTTTDDKEKKSDETDNLQQDVDAALGGHTTTTTTNSVATTPVILVGEIDLGPPKKFANGSSAGGGADGSSQKLFVADIWDATFNWKAIKRAAIIQMVLASAAMICILISIATHGMNSYKFSQFIMAMYLMLTGHSGLRGSAMSYKHLIFYLIMSALQWMINIMVLGCLTYALYETPYINYNVRQSMRGIDMDDYGTGIVMLTAEILGSLAMMGTIITGMLGLTYCCKGFGNLLANQQKFFCQNGSHFVNSV